jgi:hypothetical protein
VKDNWSEALGNVPLNTDVLLLDADGTVRMGQKWSEHNPQAFKFMLDFGDFYSSVFLPPDVIIVKWHPLPAMVQP